VQCVLFCHSERSEEPHNNKGGTLHHSSLPCVKGGAPAGRRDCHSEAQSAEESPAHPGDTLPKAETQPGSICDTCQSSPAQYDSTLACTCPHTAQLYTENRSLKEIIEKIKQTVNGVNI